MSVCAICYRDAHAVSSRGWCEACEAWDEYWLALAPAQRQSERDSMVRYVEQRS